MPGLTSFDARAFDAVSDAVDDGMPLLAGASFLCSSLAVNVLKGKLWHAEAEVEPTKDKDSFRQYDTACDRVKSFYKEQHGPCVRRLALT